MQKIIVAVIILLSAAAFNGYAQNNIKFTEYNLKNGLHVILQKDNTTPIVAVTVMYHVGSKNEEASRTGFAHFFEHLMFEGSPNIERGEYFKIVQHAGGELNANTSFDRTFYYEIFPSNQLELGLWLESERMLHLKVDSVGVETQRKVVKEERSQSLDNQPYGRLWEETFKRAFTVHPYNWMPIGSAQYIDKATISEFMDFYKTYYVPNNAVLSIAGDIDINDTKELVEKYFADIPVGTKELYRPDAVEPEKTGEVKDTVYDNVQLPAIVHAYHIPAMGTEDYYAIEMLTTLLSGGQSSKLYKTLIDVEQKALFVGAFPAGLEDPGLFVTVGIANAGVDASALDESIDEIIADTRNNLISETEYQKLQNQVESSFVNSNNTAAGIAENLANYFMFYHDTNLINTELDRYMKVTREDIKRAANKYLVKKNRLVLYYLPNSLNQNGEEK
ncbi:MAG: insulinase family protein [Ignavibacteriaceae bacterium]|nr:insulinase family protein [Ignavibacteriaceae bacterium]